MCIINRCKHHDIKASILASVYALFLRSRNVFNKVSSIICPSLAILELAARSGVDRNKLHLINHFIQDECFEVEPCFNDDNYFLYIGRLDKEKGIHYLIEAMKHVPDEIKLHIIGEGYEKENLIKQAKSLSNISFLGYLEGKELEKEYKHCIATVLPCNWLEIFGLTVIESFLYGKPVIASNIGALPEIIDNNVNGILVEPKDIDGIKSALIEFYYNRGKAVKFGQNGRSKLSQLYNSEIFFEKFSRVIDNISSKSLR